VPVPAPRSVRSFTTLTAEHLRRLDDIAEAHHRVLAARHPEWTGELLATCLVQGGARHFVHGDRGVKDLDVYLFYALPDGRSAAHFPLNRGTRHADFGVSDLGRQLLREEERADPALRRKVARWESFEGRRVDLLARAIPPHPGGARTAVREWLTRGSRKRPSAGGSDWHLSRTPVVCLRPDLGAVWWRGPDVDEPGIEKGLYP
jgi:hypothetical protein